MPTHTPPPLLPIQWSSAYISYWSPMQQDDQITSGYCWFDYARNICRIDGLFNPWSEKDTGHRLWMSEIGDAEFSQSHKQKIAYSREATAVGIHLCELALPDEISPFHELFLPRSVLLRGNARHDGCHTVLGQLADAWTIERPHKASSTFYLKAGTNLLLRMVTGNEKQHVSVRDFPNLFAGDIPDSVFALKKNEVPSR